jgi:hypothetical protein
LYGYGYGITDFYAFNLHFFYDGQLESGLDIFFAFPCSFPIFIIHPRLRFWSFVNIPPLLRGMDSFLSVPIFRLISVFARQDNFKRVFFICSHARREIHEHIHFHPCLCCPRRHLLAFSLFVHWVGNVALFSAVCESTDLRMNWLLPVRSLR